MLGRTPPSARDGIALLRELAGILGDSTDLDKVLGPVLRHLHDGFGFARVALSLADHGREEVSIEAAHGLTPAEVRRGRYSFGEGIIGRVVQTGQAETVVRISEEPRFADKTGAREGGVERSYLCVPIVVDGKVCGALSAYRPVTDAAMLDEDAAVLSVVASMLVPGVTRAVDRRGEEGVFHTDPTHFRPSEMIGNSKSMTLVYDLIAQVAPSPTTVLLLGESGTGKELVASALHHHSPRARQPFVKVNCAALPESVIESELFGHEKGAFTGAFQQRKGRFELAHNGTIFLDEIGDLSPTTQIKLLRVLQEREYERVGGNRPLHTDVRVIAATSRNLDDMIVRGTFRQDLYYRLNVFPIRLPPLRERKADILMLADHFVEVFNRAHGKRVRRISTPAIDMLIAYHWPGNVRELENCIERAVLLTRDEVLHGHHLPPSLQTAEATDTKPREGLSALVEAFEQDLVLDALKSSGGNMARAARDLQITERIMGLRVQKYGIDPRRFRKSPT